MDLGLNEKVALVLGGGGGLGSAIACILAAEGAHVVVGDISGPAAEATVAAITAQNGKAHALQWDIADPALIDGKLAEITVIYGTVDILVNITGGPPPTPVAGQKMAQWDSYFRSMVTSVIAITDAVLPAMKAKGWGRIITSTSSGVVAPIANLGLSNALRASLLGWSKTLANEIGRDGITANIIVPGRIATQRIRFLDEKKAEREGKTLEAVANASSATIPVGRYGDPQEYGDAVAFLASTRASYITGSVIRVDGGMIQSL